MHEVQERETYLVTEANLAYFVVYLHQEGLQVGTIKSYLSVVHYRQIFLGLGEPGMSAMPQLEYVIKGAKRENQQKTPERDSQSRHRFSKN